MAGAAWDDLGSPPEADVASPRELVRGGAKAKDARVKPLKYSARRGMIFLLGRGGEISTRQLKGSASASTQGTKEEAQGKWQTMVPKVGLPDSFTGTQIAVNPLSNPYEQTVAVCGLVDDEGGRYNRSLLATASVGSFSQPGPSSTPRTFEYTRLYEEGSDRSKLRVLKIAWHPRSASHLVVLLENAVTHEAFLHVHRVARRGGTPPPGPQSPAQVASAGPPEQEFRLHARGARLGYGLVKVRRRDRFVDFAFGPPSDWGLFTIFLLTRSGEVHTLCPVIPRGACFAARDIARLFGKVAGSIGEAEDDAGDEIEELETVRMWLEQVFPSVAESIGDLVGPGREVEADTEAYARLTTSLCGPLPVASPDGDGGAASSDHRSDAASLVVVPGGGACVALSVAHAAGELRCYLVAGELLPQWDLSLAGGLRDDGEDAATLLSVELDALQSSDPQLLLVDVVVLGIPEGDGEGQAEGSELRMHADGADPGALYCCTGLGVFLVRLPWVPQLAEWLGTVTEDDLGDVAEGGLDAGNGGGFGLGGLEMPAPRVQLVRRSKGAALLGSAFVSNKIWGDSVLVVEAAEGGGEVRVARVVVPEQAASESVVPDRPPVDLGGGELAGSLSELDGWYGAFLKVPEWKGRPKPLPAKGADKFAASKHVIDAAQSLEASYVRHLHNLQASLADRLRVVHAEARKQDEMREGVTRQLQSALAKVEANRGRLEQAQRRHAALLEELAVVSDQVERSSTGLSDVEVRFRAELDDFRDICGELERKVSGVKADAAHALRPGPRRRLGLSSSPTPGSYIRQLPKVRALLEEGAKVVQKNMQSVRELQSQLDQVEARALTQ